MVKYFAAFKTREAWLPVAGFTVFSLLDFHPHLKGYPLFLCLLACVSVCFVCRSHAHTSEIKIKKNQRNHIAGSRELSVRLTRLLLLSVRVIHRVDWRILSIVVLRRYQWLRGHGHTPCFLISVHLKRSSCPAEPATAAVDCCDALQQTDIK